MGSGKEYVDKGFKKFVPVTRLKYYFAVDTAYVYKKLALIFFPFAHKVRFHCSFRHRALVTLYDPFLNHFRTGQ